MQLSPATPDRDVDQFVREGDVQASVARAVQVSELCAHDER